MMITSSLFLLIGITAAQYSKTCNPIDYGAKGDGKNNDTEAIQKAMNDCYLNDHKGLVSLPSGKSFLSSALNISKVSNIGLEIQSNAVLIISNDRDKWPGSEDFLTFTDVQNLRIYGSGEINGQGQVWWANRDDFRPLTIKFEKCSHTVVQGITVKDCPNHCLELYSDYCEVDSVTILNPPSTGTNNPSHNTDGVDVHGTPFYIHDCYFSTGDDNVAVHANDTLVENCVFGTGHGASIGSLGGGWYKNITFNNIKFNGTTAGVRIKTDSGASAGKVWDIYYTNLEMVDVETSITINQFYNSDNEEKSYLFIDGVYIENITSTNGQNAGEFKCQDSTPCHHIELNNVHISAKDDSFDCEKAYGNATDTDPKSCLIPE